MTAPLIWPRHLLIPTTVKIAPQSPSRSGGQTAAGGEQVVKSPAFRWSITFTDIPLYTPDHIRVFRSIEGQLDGRANPILVPIFDADRAPALPPVATFSDGSTFSDGTGLVGASTAIELTADQAINATDLPVSWPAGGPAPTAGQHFSLGQRVYRIIKIATSDGTTTATLTIRPWLRDAWPAGTMLQFDNPHCLVRLAKDDGMAADLDHWRFGKPSVDFVEYY